MIRSLVATLATGAIVAAGAQMPVQALPVQHQNPANPTTIGAPCSNPGDTGQTVHVVRATSMALLERGPSLTATTLRCR